MSATILDEFINYERDKNKLTYTLTLQKIFNETKLAVQDTQLNKNIYTQQLLQNEYYVSNLLSEGKILSINFN